MTYTRPRYGNMTTVPNYFLLTSWEKHYGLSKRYRLVGENWKSGSLFYLCGIYLLLIFGGKKIMANRKPFELRKVLIAWNLTFSLLSLLCFVRVAHHMFHVLYYYGHYHSVCDNSTVDKDVYYMWGQLFVFFKAPELIDTLFIVLRKNPLIFLHWYHHITVLLYSWFSSYEITASARYFVAMNSFIHFLMYGYYALRVMKFRLPKTVSKTLTTLQILQMIGGIYVSYWSYRYLNMGEPCGVSKINVFWCALMYFSYFCLFCKFFFDNYLVKSKKM